MSIYTKDIEINTDFVSNYLQETVDWKSQFEMIEDVGDSLNSRKDRFDKADLIEEGIEIYSNHKIKWVDEVGRDHYITDLDVYTEMKKVNLFTPKRKQLKDNIKVKLMNSLGATKTEIPNTFEYLVLIDEIGCAIISRSDLLPHLKIVDDGIEANIPSSSLTMVTKDNRVLIETKVHASTSYKIEKDKARRSYLEQFVKKYEK